MDFHTKHIKVICLAAIAVTLSSCTVSPKPITAQERAARIEHDWQAMFKHQEPITKPLTIYTAMARAVKYNLDIRTKAAEKAFALADAKKSKFNMLPDLVASAGYTERSNTYAVLSPTTPGTISTTEDRAQQHANLDFAWNALDFGLSYFESKQKADLYLVAQERKRKILQQVIRDTRYAYWRAWAAQRVIQQIRPFVAQIQKAIRQSEAVSEQRLASPLEASRYRAELWDTFRDMNKLEYDLTKAEPELLAMVNATPSTELKLAEPDVQDDPLPKGFPTRLEKLETMALNDRPEIREEDYQHRISLNEIYKARIRMFPVVELTAGRHYDSNSFLVNKYWADVGARMSWNLLRLFSNYQGVKVAKEQKNVADIRRMALSMAIITQVNLAKMRYKQASQDLKITHQLRDSRYEYYTHLRHEHIANLTDRLVLIHAEAKWIVSRLEYFLALAEWRNAGGQLVDSVGYDPLYRVKSIDVPVAALAKEIKASLSVAPSAYFAQRQKAAFMAQREKYFANQEKEIIFHEKEKMITSRKGTPAVKSSAVIRQESAAVGKKKTVTTNKEHFAVGTSEEKTSTGKQMPMIVIKKKAATTPVAEKKNPVARKKKAVTTSKPYSAVERHEKTIVVTQQESTAVAKKRTSVASEKKVATTNKQNSNEHSSHLTDRIRAKASRIVGRLEHFLVAEWRNVSGRSLDRIGKESKASLNTAPSAYIARQNKAVLIAERKRFLRTESKKLSSTQKGR